MFRNILKKIASILTLVGLYFTVIQDWRANSFCWNLIAVCLWLYIITENKE